MSAPARSSFVGCALAGRNAPSLRLSDCTEPNFGDWSASTGGAVASRLNAAPKRDGVLRANNDRAGDDKTSICLVWRQALASDSRVYKGGDTVVRGAEEIARVTRRSPASALRLIQGGKAPIADLNDEPVALRELIDIEKYRSKAKQDLRAA